MCLFFLAMLLKLWKLSRCFSEFHKKIVLPLYNKNRVLQWKYEKRQYLLKKRKELVKGLI